MKNCKFCYKPVPSECYVLIRGRLDGKEFHVGDDSEFACDECVCKLERIEVVSGLEVGGVVLVAES